MKNQIKAAMAGDGGSSESEAPAQQTMKELVDKYYDWLKENTSVREVNEGWHVLYLPVYGLFNDNIEVYVRKDGDKITISDDGYMHRYVHNERKVQQIALYYGLSFNIRLGYNEIYCECDENSFSECLNRMIQAMTSVHLFI